MKFSLASKNICNRKIEGKENKDNQKQVFLKKFKKEKRNLGMSYSLVVQ